MAVIVLIEYSSCLQSQYNKILCITLELAGSTPAPVKEGLGLGTDDIINLHQHFGGQFSYHIHGLDVLFDLFWTAGPFKYLLL